jgi:two-component system chemotaxis response regulator CheY
MKPKALVVEDMKVHQTALKTQLLISGFDVSTANDGIEALSLLKVNQYKIVFSDIEMPNMNGLELLANIKRNIATKNIAVIMLSMVSSSDAINKALKMGAAAYLVKPFTSEKIKEIVKILGY